ncbi:phosphatase and actin regulator 3-like isoform X1 [Oncorhynchus keta]|uniref:phosphatase and actin regulator 3-like isoform X1 n=2 Tax=Oncorhynchus keta TaxID=8018 RepID=UPI0015F9ED91|nr:phosphatase and actin regulator 3-like isoform X1 [Oncorhynchus keta]
MATSDGNGIDGCHLQRGKSQSDPNLLTESSIDLVHNTVEVMDQQRVLHSGCLVSGVHTPPIRRNSKLASLGRIFKPWKWRKKKNEKLKQSSTDVALSSGCLSPEPGSPLQGPSDGTCMLRGFGGSLNATLTVSSVEYLGPEEELPPPVAEPPGDCEPEGNSSQNTEEEEEGEDEAQPGADASEEVLEGGEKTERQEEEMPRGTTPPPVAAKPVMPQMSSGDDPSTVPSHLVNSLLPKEPPRTPESLAPMVALRGPVSNPSGSPHLTNIMHLPMPPSCIMEELQRAFASKANRQESVHGPAEPGSTPWRRSDGRLSRSSSSENPSMASGGIVDWLHQAERKKEAEENKENMRLDQCFSDASGLPHDQDDWNDSVISGTLPRRLRKELLAVKLRNRPSKEELEDRNIFPARTEQERQEIRQQIEMKLTKRLSQRPNVEELESRNILKQRNDQTEQEERREIKQRLNRKLNQRPTVDELRDRKILIRFSDYVEVAKAQDYDRRADKPWTRLSAADKAAIRKELNEFKSTEMEVHASSKHLTRFHRP